MSPPLRPETRRNRRALLFGFSFYRGLGRDGTAAPIGALGADAATSWQVVGRVKWLDGIIKLHQLRIIATLNRAIISALTISGAVVLEQCGCFHDFPI